MNKLISFPVLCVFLFGCTNTFKNNNHEIIINNADKARSIVIKKNDTLSVRIILDSISNIKSFVEFNKEIIEGEALVFYPDGKLEKSIHSQSGIREGFSHFFYKSGAIKRELFYRNGYPVFYGWEYWDDVYPKTKYIFQFGTKGQIDTIKIFDKLGSLVRDSIPPVNSEYMEDQ